MDREGYIALAKGLLLELAEEELAFVGLEALSKISDRPWRDDVPTIDPDLLATAREELVEEGDLLLDSRRTRGGREVTTYLLDVPRTKTAVEAAAARKRLLLARYMGWAHGSKGVASVIGPAGEAVVRDSLRASGAPGLILHNNANQATHFLGRPVSGGPLDSLAHQLVPNDATPVVVDIPIEVKNTRGWIYPWSQELFQLLFKAAAMQVAHPDRLLLPVLVCRRMAYMTGRMAKELGFFGIELLYQPISTAIDRASLAEVQTGLGFVDLLPELGPHDGLMRRFEHTLPVYAAASAERWRLYAPLLADAFEVLRANLPDRRGAMSVLYGLIRTAPHWNRDWPAKPRE